MCFGCPYQVHIVCVFSKWLLSFRWCFECNWHVLDVVGVLSMWFMCVYEANLRPLQINLFSSCLDLRVSEACFPNTSWVGSPRSYRALAFCNETLMRFLFKNFTLDEEEAIKSVVVPSVAVLANRCRLKLLLPARPEIRKKSGKYVRDEIHLE